MLNMDDVELTISLRHDLAHSIKRYAEKAGQTPEEFVVGALWALREERAREGLAKIQEGYHLRLMRLGLFSEEDLFRYLDS